MEYKAEIQARKIFHNRVSNEQDVERSMIGIS